MAVLNPLWGFLFGGYVGYIGDSYVYTERGLVRAQRIYPSLKRMPPKSSSPCVVGLAGEGNVVKTFSIHCGGEAPVLKVSLEHGFVISATADAEVRAFEGTDLVWRKVGDLRVRDRIAVPTGLNLWGKKPFSSQKQTMPGWSRESFIAFLKKSYRNSMSRYGAGIRLRAGSRDSSQIMQLQLANLGFMSSQVMSRSSCCKKHFVTLLGDDSRVLSQYIRKGDARVLGGRGFQIHPCKVESVSKGQERVLNFEVPEEGFFAVSGFVIRGV